MKYITTTFFLLVFTMAAITASAQLGIGTETPDSSAALDVESTERGVLIPRMTVIQRDAINNPASGLMVYVTDFQCMQVNDGTPAEPLWRCVSGIGGSSGYVMALSNCASPTVNIASRPLIENELANGITVDIDYVGGNGGTYKAETVRSTGVMGLTAMLPAGSFATGDSIVRFTITGTPTSFGTANFAISVGGKRCTIGLRVIRLYTYGFPSPTAPDSVTSTTGQVWLDRNMDAFRAATSLTDTAAYGGLYQWGRATDGHQVRSLEDTLSTLATTAVPLAGNDWDGYFLKENLTPFNWLSTQDNTLWQGVNGTNNPCPTGYRLPTSAEWQAEYNVWILTGPTIELAAFNSPLKLIFAGLRSNGDANISGMGLLGFYWTSDISTNPDRSQILQVFQVFGTITNQTRATGASVRCILD
jgi:hypothetical protein